MACLNYIGIADMFEPVDFIIEAKTAVELHAEIARAVEETSGTQDTKTKMIRILHHRFP